MEVRVHPYSHALCGGPSLFAHLYTLRRSRFFAPTDRTRLNCPACPNRPEELERLDKKTNLIRLDRPAQPVWSGQPRRPTQLIRSIRLSRPAWPNQTDSLRLPLTWLAWNDQHDWPNPTKATEKTGPKCPTKPNHSDRPTWLSLQVRTVGGMRKTSGFHNHLLTTFVCVWQFCAHIHLKGGLFYNRN